MHRTLQKWYNIGIKLFTEACKNTLSDIRNYVSTLSEEQLTELFSFIGEMLSLNFMTKNIHTEFKENRFKAGHICVHCGSLCVVKNGHSHGKQRYKCKDCNKQFNDLTLFSLSCTKLPLTKWLDYAKSMLFGMSIRKSAELIDVCVKTSFYMRHKILDCLKEYLGVGNVKGIVEVDETFHAVSYKGNHKKSGFTLPRPARRRGKEVKLRGISNEQVCIVTALDVITILFLNLFAQVEWVLMSWTSCLKDV